MRVNTERGAPCSRNVISAHPHCGRGDGGAESGRRRRGTCTMRKKINANCLSHRAAPKYISARPALPRQKTLLGHTEPLCTHPPLPSLPFPSRMGSPDRTSLQSTTVYINLSHFPCKDFRTVRNFNKRKLLFCSACSGNNTNNKKKRNHGRPGDECVCLLPRRRCKKQARTCAERVTLSLYGSH